MINKLTHETRVLNTYLKQLTEFVCTKSEHELEEIEPLLLQKYKFSLGVTYDTTSKGPQSPTINIETCHEIVFLEVIKLLMLRGEMLSRIEHVYWMKKNCLIKDDKGVLWNIDYRMKPKIAK